MMESSTLLTLDEEIPFAMISKPLIHSRKTLHSYEKLILISLFSYAQQGSTAFPSLNTIASEVGTSKPTIIKHLKTLEEKEILKKKKRFSSRGDNTSNLYILSRKNLLNLLNQEVVKEVYPGSKGGLLPVVKEVYPGSKGGLLPVVKEVYPNNKYKETEILKKKIKEKKKRSLREKKDPETTFGRIKRRLEKIKNELTSKGYEKKLIQEWSEGVWEKHSKIDDSKYNSLHTLDPHWIEKDSRNWDSLKESLDLFLATNKQKWYLCITCHNKSCLENEKQCRDCRKPKEELLKQEYDFYIKKKTEDLKKKNSDELTKEYDNFLSNPLIKIQLERVKEENLRWQSFLQSRGLLLNWEEWLKKTKSKRSLEDFFGV